jgi:quercetin dioxygenase-like cupin family protein
MADQTRGKAGVTYEPAVSLHHDPLLGNVVRSSDVPGYSLAEVTGNPHDQGTGWALIGPSINGAAEFSGGIYTMGPGQVHPPHYHPVGPELYYIVTGSCLVQLDNDEFEVGSDTAIYIPEGSVHAVSTRPNESVTIFYVFALHPDTQKSTVWLE